MENRRLEEMKNGWFAGPFLPRALHLQDTEVGVKYFKKGDKDPIHYHLISSEATVVIAGRIKMAGKEWREGDVIILSPGEASSCEALTDAILVVVKHPSAPNDKYLVGE